MFLLSSIFSSNKPINLTGIFDYHSHILPGVDEGVEDMETSFAILDDYEQAEIREVWLTLHIMEDVPNTTHDLMERFDDLISAYRGKVTMRLTSENMIHSLLIDTIVFFTVVLLTGVMMPQILLIAFRENLFDAPDSRMMHKIAVPCFGEISLSRAIRRRFHHLGRVSKQYLYSI